MLSELNMVKQQYFKQFATVNTTFIGDLHQDFKLDEVKVKADVDW